MKKISYYILFLFTLTFLYQGCSNNPVNPTNQNPPPVDTSGPWKKKISNTTYNLTSVYFTNESTGWICGSGIAILKTTNGGTNWVISNSPVYGYTYIWFVNDLTGYSCAMFGNFVKTNDGGQSWIDLPTGNQGNNFNSISFPSTDTGYMTGEAERV